MKYKSKTNKTVTQTGNKKTQNEINGKMFSIQTKFTVLIKSGKIPT